MALAIVLHHFYNTRLTEERLQDIDKSVVKTVRKVHALYTTTTNLVIYLPREYGGIGVKRVSDVYRTTRLAFLVKMLNHDVPQFRNMARESLRLDMVKRGVPLSENIDNFLGYDLNANGFLNARTRFGCQSDWPDMLRYACKLGVKVIFRNGKAEITHNDLTLDEIPKLQKRLFRTTIDRDLQNSKELSIQGPFLGLNDIQIKASHSIFYNWNISDDLVRFAARLSLLPTNFTTHIWNRTNDPCCPFCFGHTESVAHLFNGYKEFYNFSNRRHDRIVGKLFDELKLISIARKKVYTNKLLETLLPENKEELTVLQHRKSDIVIMDETSRDIVIAEVTMCFHLYFGFSFPAKCDRYQELCGVLRENGLKPALHVLCFGALGCIKDDVYELLRNIGLGKAKTKELLSWCSISNIFGANYIWKHRVKKLNH